MGSTAIVLRHLLFEDLGLLHDLLNARGYRIRYLDAGIDDVSAQVLAEAELVVILGGPIGVYDGEGYPFLDTEQGAIADRLATGGATLGICLGAQLMARALGAPVTATGRSEIGYGPLTLTSQGRSSVLAALDSEPVLHWHGDQFEIPAGAERLAQTPGFPNQAFSAGPHALGLQFHLEADHRRIEQWLIGHAHELATVGIDPSRIRADAARHGPALAQRARTVMHSWLDQLP
ncbi:MAG: glutamine amidotransferase [Beutenbergiaceae bacterium]